MSEKDDEQAGFDDAGLDDDAAGFNSVDGADAPTETPEQDAKTEQPAVVEQPAVEYVQLTKAERDELMGLRAQQEKSFGTAFGKIGGIERTLQQLSSGAQVEISQEDIDALKDDFPPLAAALEKVRSMRALPGAGMPAEQLDELVQQRIAPALQRMELRMLAKDHPDFKQIDADPSFAAWVQAQPDEFKQTLAKASAEYDSEVVSNAMTKFKQSRAKPSPAAANPATPTRTSRMQAAITPRGSGGAHATADSTSEQAGFDSVQ
jgi:hypothetical protein